MVLSNSVVAFQGFLSSTEVAPGIAVEVCLFVAVNLAQAETGNVQFTPTTGAYFPFGLGMVTGLGLAADQCTPPALGQLPFVLAALAQRVYAATGEVLAVEAWLLVEGIHFVSDFNLQLRALPIPPKKACSRATDFIQSSSFTKPSSLALRTTVLGDTLSSSANSALVVQG